MVFVRSSAIKKPEKQEWQAVRERALPPRRLLIEESPSERIGPKRYTRFVAASVAYDAIVCVPRVRAPGRLLIVTALPVSTVRASPGISPLFSRPRAEFGCWPLRFGPILGSCACVLSHCNMKRVIRCCTPNGDFMLSMFLSICTHVSPLKLCASLSRLLLPATRDPVQEHLRTRRRSHQKR